MLKRRLLWKVGTKAVKLIEVYPFRDVRADY